MWQSHVAHVHEIRRWRKGKLRAPHQTSLIRFRLGAAEAVSIRAAARLANSCELCLCLHSLMMFLCILKLQTTLTHFDQILFSESANSQDHVSVGASGTHELAQSAGLSQVGVGAATSAAITFSVA